MCTCKLPFWLNSLSHTLHRNGFSPVWVRLWQRRLETCENDLGQRSHANGFAPVWMRWWLISDIFCEKILWQTSQVKVFEADADGWAVWRWRLSWSYNGKMSSHESQGNCRPSGKSGDCIQYITPGGGSGLRFGVATREAEL